MWILPAFLLRGHHPADRSIYLNRLSDVVGVGPYRPVRWTATRVSWISYPHYFRGPAHIARMVWTWSHVRAQRQSEDVIYPVAKAAACPADMRTWTAVDAWGLVAQPAFALSPAQARDLTTVIAASAHRRGHDIAFGPRPLNRAHSLRATVSRRVSRPRWTILAVARPTSSAARAILARVAPRLRAAGVRVALVAPNQAHFRLVRVYRVIEGARRSSWPEPVIVLAQQTVSGCYRSRLRPVPNDPVDFWSQVNQWSWAFSAHPVK
jgi:hypothetical protein